MTRPKALTPRDDFDHLDHDVNKNWHAQYQNEHHAWTTITGPGPWKSILQALRDWQQAHLDPDTQTCDTETRMTLR